MVLANGNRSEHDACRGGMFAGFGRELDRGRPETSLRVFARSSPSPSPATHATIRSGLYEYEPGSWGPPQADQLVADVGGGNSPV